MEILFELFFEIALEITMAIVDGLFCALSDRVMSSTKVRRRVKWIIGTILLSGVVALTIYALCTKTGPLITASLIYILAISLAHGAIFYLRHTQKAGLLCFLRWVCRIINYSFSVAAIVLAGIYVNELSARITLIVSSIIAIIIYLCVDFHRFRVKYDHNEPKQERRTLHDRPKIDD